MLHTAKNMKMLKIGHEINKQAKYRKQAQIGKLYDNLLKSVKREVSFITYISIMKLVRSSVSVYSDSVKSRHANKISHLSRHKILDVSGLDSSKIVINLSSLKLSNTDVNILSRGLAYSVAPQQLDSVDIRTSFETFYRQLLSVLPTHCLNRFKQRLKRLCFTYIYGYKRKNFYNLTKDEFLAFRQLCRQKDVLFCKPDKGNGVVILDKSEYINKIQTILDDKKKFRPLNKDPTDERETDLQDYLKLLLTHGVFSEEVYNKLGPVGSNPSRIYGLPKIHKPDIPLRPIISAIGSYTHSLAKFLSEILKPYAQNEYTIKDSFSFVNELLSVSSIPFMCSLDVVSLFTNIPVDETIDICINLLYEKINIVQNLNRYQFQRLLYICVKANHFSFGDKLFDQVDGVAMGSPLGPVLANIFMSKFEKKVLKNYGGNKPLFYRRFVDDTYLIFHDRDDCELFLEYVNCQHSSIKFTLEVESNNSLPFLDVI